ncbi:MAG: beta-ketoacyl synthase chain length factor [Tannerella sp.]|jgi:3-oxoacyl-(acyl-carrier-protein) synthase|nr:beta-ketoacyl synthase chain length factor [Tannerella sp.]
MSVYIQSASQISAQRPLCDAWFETPIYHETNRVSAIDPDFTSRLSPLQSRRMCRLLKRVIVTAHATLQDAGLEMPDAIISGTGLGCIDNTEKFLHSILKNGEQYLQPTYFMQSTHNIISSLIAIDLKCHGYNNTYVHRGVSFEHALLDALLQFRRQRIRTALVGGYDEMTDYYYLFLRRLGEWNFTYAPAVSPKQKCFSGEVAVSLLLSDACNERSLCEINGVELLFRPSAADLRRALDTLLAQAGCSPEDLDAVMTGVANHPQNDPVYEAAAAGLFAGRPLAQYKHLFGQSFSSSALGLYAAAVCLSKRRIPAHLMTGRETGLDGVRRILFYNHYHHTSHSLTLLSRC